MSDYPAPDDSMFQEPQMDSMEEESYPKHPCRLCDGFIQAGKDKSKWGLDWYRGYVHFSCIENIFDATRRMRNKPEVAQLEADLENIHNAYDKVLLLLGDEKAENERLNKAFDWSAVKVAELKAENEALVKIVAQSAHEEHCYAENWWDSSCDCGLMDLVLQLSPRLQNAIDDERKSWEDKSIYSDAAKGFLEGRKIDTLIVDPPDALLTGED